MQEIVFKKEFSENFYNSYVLTVNKLCDRAKQIFFDFLMENKDAFMYFDNYCYDIENQTPIEQIFLISLCYVCSMDEIISPNIEVKSDLPLPLLYTLLEEIEPQSLVHYNDKNYVVDFEINFTRKNKFGQNVYEKPFSKLKYVVELDGNDFHSSKKQREYDYSRENDLKQLGYSIIRFTGSQIYNHPFQCVKEMISIVINDIQRGLE